MAAQLKVSREEATQKIEAQVKAGRALIQEQEQLALLWRVGDSDIRRQVRDRDSQWEADTHKWVEYTEEVLRYCFTDDSEALAFKQRFDKGLHGPEHSGVTIAVTLLESIRDRLPLIAEEAASTTPAPRTEPPEIEEFVFRQDGDFWSITYEAQSLPSLKALDGFLYISYLLQHPNEYVSISTLRALKDKRQPDPRLQPYEAMSQGQLAEEGLHVSTMSDTAGLDRQGIAQVRAKKAEIEEELSGPSI